MKITVIGESNIDIAVVPQSEPNKIGCTPSRIRFHHGGVARNIAHNLSLLGHDIYLMTVFGGDDFAKSLIEDCKSIGMNLSLSSQFKDERSPIFLSFNDESGNMKSAASDIAFNDRLNLDWLKSKMDAVNQSNLVVADTLLSADALSFLIDHCEAPVYIDAVSQGKAKRFSEALKKSRKASVFALKCNLVEAVALTGKNDAFEAVKDLNNKGINHVYLTLGSDGAIHCSENVVTAYPAMPEKVVNVTGSGDAFFAGIIHAHSVGVFGKEAVIFGLKAAQHNIKSEAPVNPTLRLSVFND